MSTQERLFGAGGRGDDVPDDVTLSARVPAGLRIAYTERAQDRGVTLSDLVRAALEAYVTEPHPQPTVADVHRAATKLGLRTTNSAGAGTRGGPAKPLELDEATELLARWRAEQWGWLRRHILRLACRPEGFHGDDLTDEELDQRNMIGAAVNALARRDLIRESHRRRSTNPASHGRKSGVYIATDRGRELARIEAGIPPHVPDDYA